MKNPVNMTDTELASFAEKGLKNLLTAEIICRLRQKGRYINKDLVNTILEDLMTSSENPLEYDEIQKIIDRH